MASRSSEQDNDGVVWQTVGMRLGTQGIDLRTPADPTALTELLNARFIDDRNIRQRDGHDGTTIQDRSDFAPLGPNYAVDDGWVYGHGMRVSSINAAGWENAHHPVAGRGQATFRYRDADVVHTGDRLLVVDQFGQCIGASDYWSREIGGDTLNQGIPAFLPVQTDGTPPAEVGGEYVDTCLTSKYRAFIYNGPTGKVFVWILNRDTGAVVDFSEISGPSDDPVETRVVCSGDTLVALWRDFTDRNLYLSWWTGLAWATATAVVSHVGAYDVCVVPGGFHVLWRDENLSLLRLGKYLGPTAQAVPYNFGTVVSTSDPPVGAIALGVDPLGGIGVAYQGTSLRAKVLNFDATTPFGYSFVTLGDNVASQGGLNMCARGLKNGDGVYDWVLHWNGFSGSYYARSCSFDGQVVTAGTQRWNTYIASKSFRVGDEVFCWYRANNVGTHYLVSGAGPQTVCGFSDREEAISRTSHDGNYGVPMVQADPRDATGTLFTWTRPFNTGQTYGHPGNVRYGDMNFLPDVCAVQYGRSVYLSGSAVRNWDGVSLGDAGFQDYPIVLGNPTDAGIQATGGSLTTGGTYFVRVYAARYSARGERFETAALTFGPIVMTGSNNKLNLQLATLPDTNHDDLELEVYCTESLGTTFYFDGTVSNDLSNPSVSYSITMSDAARIKQEADPHAAGVGALSELENWGPLGCSILAVSGDRLWGAGGQVTPGFVQFSKLHEDGSGAGFDDLAGFQEMNTEGNAITSISPLNDATVVFETQKLYALSGTGPDNYGNGAFDIPQIVLADGAITHFGTVFTQAGVVFWGQEGPRLLNTQLTVLNICAPIRKYSETLTPSGVRVDLSLQEVVWYTSGGDALLWNYLDGASRFARWNGLNIAGTSAYAQVTTDGVLLIPDVNAVGDNGRPFQFAWETGDLRPDSLLQGSTLIRAIGIAGEYLGDHQLRARVYYNGSDLWIDEWIWQPEGNTWLAAGTTMAGLTPAQVDALKPLDKSGGYAIHKRVSRQNCRFFRVRVDNLEADAPTYTPFELSLELGGIGGLGRTPAGVFTGNSHA